MPVKQRYASFKQEPTLSDAGYSQQDARIRARQMGFKQYKYYVTALIIRDLQRAGDNIRESSKTNKQKFIHKEDAHGTRQYD